MHGPHPKDRTLFAESELLKIREAAVDLRYLLGRGYAQPSALSLTGDRLQLTSRQRQLLFRGVCAPADAERVTASRLRAEAVRGASVLVDGHNVLITVETALAGGLLLRSDDSFFRDIAEKHGAYRQSEHTGRALEILRDGLRELRPARVACYLDKPIPFSGLLAERMREAVGQGALVTVVASADGAILKGAREDPNAVIATGDSAMLRQALRTFDLTGYLVARWVPEAWIVSLSSEEI